MYVVRYVSMYAKLAGGDDYVMQIEVSYSACSRNGIS